MILVTAANGRTGRSVVWALARRGQQVRAFDIHPDVAQLKGLGAAETVVGDLLNPDALAGAVEGARVVVHIGPPMHPHEAEMGHAVVSAARRAEVEHFVQFSVTHPQLEPLLNHQAKLAVERAVLLSRLPFTILQPMHYMQNLDVVGAVTGGVLTQPYAAETPLAHVDLEDVAEVAALVAGDPHHHYATYELCGDDFLTTHQLAAVIAAASGRPVVARQVTPPERRLAAAMPSGPQPVPSEEEDYRREAMARLFDHYGQYGITGNPNVLTWLLGRPPTSFDRYVRRALRAAAA